MAEEGSGRGAGGEKDSRRVGNCGVVLLLVEADGLATAKPAKSLNFLAPIVPSARAVFLYFGLLITCSTVYQVMVLERVKEWTASQGINHERRSCLVGQGTTVEGAV